MKLYFAAPPNGPDREALYEVNHPWVLYSYHYYKKEADHIKEATNDLEINTFVDSGAFSAMTKGVEIDIDEYAKWLLDVKPTMYATLDAIGDPIKTLENTKYLENEYGLKPLPVFHMKTDIKYLYPLLEDYDYICLGGMVKSQNLIPWLDRVWAVILQEKPELKVHGFGLTGRIIKNYPFYSVDSSSWANGVRFAQVTRYNPHKNKLYDIDLALWAQQNGIGYYKGDPITGWKRFLVINVSCRAHMDFNKHIQEVHETKDFNYLTAQQSLF